MQSRINPIQSRTKTTQPMNAATVCFEAQSMLHQLSMPIDPRDTIKARRERAIRRAGISPAKGFRLWYGYATALMAHEYLMICEAAKAHVRTQEAQLETELEQLRALKAAHEQRTRQHDFLAATVSENDVGAVRG
jgi:hypothetical protein